MVDTKHTEMSETQFLPTVVHGPISAVVLKGGSLDKQHLPHCALVRSADFLGPYQTY